MTHVFLVPGLFGFTSLAGLDYFLGVESVLRGHLDQRGVNAEISVVPTLPTGSLTRRAAMELKWMVDNGATSADSLHLVGHSTGGLDIRLLATPGSRLVPGDVERDVGERIKSVITISTPHFGTPFAQFTINAFQRQFFEVASSAIAGDVGRYSIFALTKVLSACAHMDDWLGRDNTFLDRVANLLLRNITPEQDSPLWQYMRSAASDQGAVLQLTHESMHLFNAAVSDRPTTRYSSIVTVAPPPPSRYHLADAISPAMAARMLIFTVFYYIAGRENHQYPYCAPGVARLPEFDIPFDVSATTTDGIVPAQSQAYGELLDVILGDHLDVVGHFRGDPASPHIDWLPSGAGFTRARFVHTWGKVADAIAAAENGGPR